MAQLTDFIQCEHLIQTGSNLFLPNNEWFYLLVQVLFISVVSGCALCSWPASVATWRRWSGPRGSSAFPSWTTGGRRVGLALLSFPSRRGRAGRAQEAPECSPPRLREDYRSALRRCAKEMFQGLGEPSRGNESSALLSARRLEE